MANTRKPNENKRQKRLFIPLIYFLVEVAGIWLLISLFQISFDVKEWAVLAIVFLAGVSFQRLLKMIKIYNR